MKKILFLSAAAVFLVISNTNAQTDKKKATTEKATETVKEDKSKRPSPPAVASETTASGNKITINYSQPGIKGRTIGKEIAPYGKVWRTGANEATTIELSKDAKINGRMLMAGKYSIHSIPGEKKWKIMFNKTWDKWGTDYDANNDVMTFDIEPQKNPEFVERLTFNINKEGRTVMMWGNVILDFMIN